MTTISSLLQKTKEASAILARIDDGARSELLMEMADVLLKKIGFVLAENQKDLDLLSDSDPKKDRLKLTESRIAGLAESLQAVSKLPDPTNRVLLERNLPNGLQIKKMAVPLGVAGIIYESRPNVTMDVSALCLRSGNAVVLKGGKEAERSNTALVQCIYEALSRMNLPAELVLLLPSDRSVVQEMFMATRFLDVLIPRGSDQLIQFVRQNSLVPTIETGAGVVHIYVHQSADLQMATDIIVNAKTSRPSVCNALDCVLADKEIATELMQTLAPRLTEFQVLVHADESSFSVLETLGYPFLSKAREEDFGKEWLDFALSIKVVVGMDEALRHIAQYSSRHSEAIITNEQEVAAFFLEEVDAAAVYVNASTRFTDGGEFGLGAEIGISTQKLHARGPFALEKLVTEKWVIRGNGQIRI
jgi:glutamate-5-semialdehyde dehydrogenase